MKDYGRMKVDYLKRSKERIRDLESEIEGLGKRFPLFEKEKPTEKVKGMVNDLKEEAKVLELNVDELEFSNSDSWDWALEIEDTEWLFKVLKERIDRAKRILEENDKDTFAGNIGEKTEIKTKG